MLQPIDKAAHRFIIQYLAQHGYPPTIREIGRALGGRSTSVVSMSLRRLEGRGMIERKYNSPRAIRVISNQIHT